MKRMQNFLIIIVLLMFGSLIGCSTTQKQYALDSSMFAVEVGIFDKQWDQVEELVRIKQTTENIFTDAEWRKLLNVDASVDMLMLKAKAILQLDPENISLADVELMYSIAKEGYRQAYEVLSSHWTQFSPSDQVMLNALNEEAEMIDVQINKLLHDPTNRNITKTLTMITGVLALAVKMIGVAVL